MSDAVQTVTRVNRRHFNQGIGCRCGWQPKHAGVGVLWMEELDEHIATEVVAALGLDVRKAQAQALRDTTEAWQVNGWADVLLPATTNPIEQAQRVTDWLRDRIEQEP